MREWAGFGLAIRGLDSREEEERLPSVQRPRLVRLIVPAQIRSYNTECELSTHSLPLDVLSGNGRSFNLLNVVTT